MTEYVNAMAELVRRIHPALKTAGFRKRRYAFNRSAEDGLVQVISFQMGPKMPPGVEPILPWRPDLYGRFTVNLGVAIQEAWEQSPGSGSAFPAFIHDYDCQIRSRLGQIIDANEDLWWSLDLPTATLVDTVGEALTGPALDWLTRRGSREAILRMWRNGGHRKLPMPTALPIVMILRRLDLPDEAATVMRDYYETITDRTAHRRYVYGVAQGLNIDGLTPP